MIVRLKRRVAPGATPDGPFVEPGTLPESRSIPALVAPGCRAGRVTSLVRAVNWREP